MITITIETENAAFDPDAAGALEVVRILRDLADEYEALDEYRHEEPRKIFDINGNLVGYATYKPTKS